MKIQSVSVESIKPDFSTQVLLQNLSELVVKQSDVKVKDAQLNLDKYTDQLIQAADLLKSQKIQLNDLVKTYKKSELQFQLLTKISRLKKDGLLTGSLAEKCRSIVENIDRMQLEKMEAINEKLSKYTPEIPKVSYG